MYRYKPSSVWTIPRFGHQKGPLVFRGLERSLGLENLAYIAEVENSNSVGEALEKILQTNLTFFFQEKAKNVAHSDEIHREKLYLMRKKKH